MPYKDRGKKRESTRKWWAANREKYNATKRVQYAAKPEREKRNEYARAWRTAHPEKKRESDRARYAAHPEKQHARSRKHLYGLTEAMYRQMFDEQSGRCALCYKDLNGAAVIDHKHQTSHVRGILHPWCNNVLAFAKEDVMVLRLAVTYLDKHNSEPEGGSREPRPTDIAA